VHEVKREEGEDDSWMAAGQGDASCLGTLDAAGDLFQLGGERRRRLRRLFGRKFPWAR